MFSCFFYGYAIGLDTNVWLALGSVLDKQSILLVFVFDKQEIATLQMFLRFIHHSKTRLNTSVLHISSVSQRSAVRCPVQSIAWIWFFYEETFIPHFAGSFLSCCLSWRWPKANKVVNKKLLMLHICLAKPQWSPHIHYKVATCVFVLYCTVQSL